MQKLYDMHTHTDSSHDSPQPIEPLCRAAVAAGLAGLAITDHGDSPYLDLHENRRTIARSTQQAAEMARQFAGRLEVLCGVEIGEECWAPEGAAVLHELAPYDVILASMHGFYRDGKILYYSQEPFDAAHYTEAQLYTFLEVYQDAVAQNAETADYDVMCHLDCPVRYINGKYHREVDILKFSQKIEDILRIVIRRQKTLEVNTSGRAGSWGQWMPTEPVLRWYRALGGEKICLGSDAHIAQNLAADFDAGAALLGSLGFAGQTVYRKRTAFLQPFENFENNV